MTIPHGYDHRDGKGWSWLESWAEDMDAALRRLEARTPRERSLADRVAALEARVAALERINRGNWP